MGSFFAASGPSPPPGCSEDIDRNDQEGVHPLPEELVEVLAGLLAQALVNDIRQYPQIPVN
jgi:hypothetical protein